VQLVEPGAKATDPGSHASQRVAPAFAWNEPGGQSEQVVWPASEAKVPAVHGAQGSLPVALTLPGAHGCAVAVPICAKASSASAQRTAAASRFSGCPPRRTDGRARVTVHERNAPSQARDACGRSP
jgi:hypothetical protein